VRSPDPGRGIYCNRTLNLRSIDVIGYDMDYTLVHYRTEEWEGRAYHHAKLGLAAQGWPVDDLEFDPSQVIQGLVIDLELGNLLKVTRFGYVIRALHGTRPLGYDDLRTAYLGVVVELGEPRWVFLNTLFSLSEATLFAQLVGLADAGRIPGVVGYDDLYRAVRRSLDEAHVEGTLKAEILDDPDTFIRSEPEVVTTLLDQRRSGKHLMLITNSDWAYAREIMSHAFDPYMDDGRTWRDLFDTVIVSADKPAFFEGDRRLYRVADEEQGLLQPHLGPLESGGVFYGGTALQVEESLGVSGDQILYVGDHLFGDVHASKSMLRWRTALVIRELEAEIEAQLAFAEGEGELQELMGEKQAFEERLADLRLLKQRRRHGQEGVSIRSIDQDIDAVRSHLAALDERITPLAKAAGTLLNAQWGLLMRSGADKSLFARQVERHADVYTSRVSNFLTATPYAYLRAARTPLPHDE
jgi:HAD superfamily 5'-nucleotidase-like hydrolase